MVVERLTGSPQEPVGDHGGDWILRGASEIVIPERYGSGVERRKNWALVAKGGQIIWSGPEKDFEAQSVLFLDRFPVIDAAGCAVLPAFVDPHTHLIYGGDRVEDFAARAAGKTYAEILAAGGGIMTTVARTRMATDAELLDGARRRLRARAAAGIGTTEIKSGYGLSVAEELRILRLIRELRKEGWGVEATLLGAHVVPAERRDDRTRYIAEIIEEMIPMAARRHLARFCDVFVEQSAFTVNEARRIFTAARHHGLIPRLHADQLSSGGGAELAAEVGAASADHLEHISDEGIQRMRAGKVVAVLLPAAMTFLGKQARDLGQRLIAGGVEVAIGTDSNPGSSPTDNLALCATLAVTQMGLTVEQALRAATLGAAHALRRDDIGTLAVGSRAACVILGHPDARAWVYGFGDPEVRAVGCKPRVA